MTYLPPDIVDNDAATLAEALTRTIQEVGQRRLDIATGYFTPEVWRLVGGAFAALDAFRLLLGERPDVGYGGHDTVDLRRYYRKKLADDLASLAFDREHAALVDALTSFFVRDDVAMRLFSGPFLHAKAYIFDRVSFVGSSNFTPSGLTRNSELMLSDMREGTAHGLRAWFENKWAESLDYKPEFLETLAASKFGSRPYSPFEIFIKALYEYFKDRISLDPESAVAAVDLARFQEEGRADAIRLLDRWGGVLVADAVGLGKTYMGLSLLEHELLAKRKRGRALKGLVICPAQLRELVWQPRVADYGIPLAGIISQEELGRENFDWKRFLNVDVVLVDESHNFRNPSTNRYRNLIRLISGGRRKRIILMTATPVNNTLYDLYHQIMLLARSDDRYYRVAGIPNLQRYFKAVSDGGLEIFDLLEETTVRRSRADIRRRQEAGEEIVIGGKIIRFPERRLERIDYDLDGTYQGLYEEITHAIEALNLVSYNLAAFARSKTSESRQQEQRNTALIALMKMLYLKRLESSAAAFEASMTRQAGFQERFLAILQKGRLLDAATYRKLLVVENDEERAEPSDEVLGALAPADPAAYDMEGIGQLVAQDVAALRHIAGLVQSAREQTQAQGGDDKVCRIKDLLAGKLKSKKVLIFTSYHDSAVYVHRMLTDDAEWRERAGNPVVGIISGDTKAEERRVIVQRFAPVANRPADDRGGLFWKPEGEEIQILISTDVLSEGQNLQDAGVIINYDLHWNPVRLIQRAGRVDRIGSAFDHIELYNVFPEDELENLLGLVHRLADRIAAIDRSVGLDASVLGEIVSGRSLDQLRQLHRNDQNVLNDLERQAELISIEDMKFPLVSYIQQIGESVVADIPMGIRSGKRVVARNARPGTFLAFAAGARHFWRFYPDGGEPPESAITKLYAMIQCSTSEPRIEPGAVPYELIERATQDILEAIRGEQARLRTKVPLSAMTNRLYNWINRQTLWESNIALDEDQLRRLNGVLETVHLKTYERDPLLKGIVKAYEQDSDFVRLVTDLDAYFADNGLYLQSDVDIQTAEAIKEEDLHLVCFERLELARQL